MLDADISSGTSAVMTCLAAYLCHTLVALSLEAGNSEVGQRFVSSVLTRLLCSSISLCETVACARSPCSPAMRRPALTSVLLLNRRSDPALHCDVSRRPHNSLHHFSQSCEERPPWAGSGNLPPLPMRPSYCIILRNRYDISSNNIAYVATRTGLRYRLLPAAEVAIVLSSYAFTLRCPAAHASYKASVSVPTRSCSSGQLRYLLPACHAMSGTQIADGAVRYLLRACDVITGTETA
eukprot:3601771-Rhodomonas_salina.2